MPASNCLVAIQVGNNVFGTLVVEKTHLDAPVFGEHYAVLVPTSTVSKENLVSEGIKTIGYKTLQEELSDIDDDGNKVERKLLVRWIGDDENKFFMCKTEESDLSVGDKNLFLVTPFNQVASDMAVLLKQSIASND